MRNALVLAALLTLHYPSLAQDPHGPAGEPEVVVETAIPAQQPITAASLFYRAFWLEQAGGKLAEAEKLYAKIVVKHARSPEAPRAYLALIRIRSVRGEDVTGLVRKLETEHPQAKREIERAREHAARRGSEFDLIVRPDDTPLDRKLKTIYTGLSYSASISSEDRDVLSDMGAAGHPMLARLLRSPNGPVVKRTAELLLTQLTKEANAVVESALRDPAVLYRMSIIDEVRRSHAFSPSMMRTLRELWPKASRSLRRRIAATWATGTFQGEDSVAQCYEYLAMALTDEDSEVRRSATLVSDGYDKRPAEYIKALLPLCLKNDPSVERVWRWFPWQVKHEALAAEVAKAVVHYPKSLTFTQGRRSPVWSDESTALAMVTFVSARLRMNLPVNSRATEQFGGFAAASSGLAASKMLDLALQYGSAELANAVFQGLKSRRMTGAERNRYVPRADALRTRAIAQNYDEDKQRATAARMVLAVLSVRAEDLPAIVKGARTHPETGILSTVISMEYIRQLGPERAAQLVPLATQKQLDGLIGAGATSWNTSDKGRRPVETPQVGVFWAAILSRFHATNSDPMVVKRLAFDSEELADMVAAWLLDQQGADFAWRFFGKENNVTLPRHGAGLLSAAPIKRAYRRARLRGRLLKLVADPRFEIANVAFAVAKEGTDEQATLAVRRALDSPWVTIVRSAIEDLHRRGPQGSAILAGYLQRAGVPSDLRDKALNSFRQSDAKAQLPFVLAQLDKRVGEFEATVMWDLAFAYDRDATVDRALKEVSGTGPVGYRFSALQTLRRSSDPRRVPIFREVLRESKDSGRVRMILVTVADQYLIELGPEVLMHLRNPDSSIRDTATEAIERLKFYAEAKKIFEKEDSKSK